MASYVVQDTQLTAIASAIRTKSGTIEDMTIEEMPSKIGEIETSAGGGGGSVETCTVEVVNTTGIFWNIYYSYINESGVSTMMSGVYDGNVTELSNVIAFSGIAIWSDNNAGGVPYEFEANGAYLDYDYMLGGETLAIFQTYPENGNNVTITIM